MDEQQPHAPHSDATDQPVAPHWRTYAIGVVVPFGTLALLAAPALVKALLR
jgi:hypothetical protein